MNIANLIKVLGPRAKMLLGETGGQMGNLARGGKQIMTGGAGALAGSGGKAEALKGLLMANKLGVGAVGAGAAGLAGAGYGAKEMMEDEDEGDGASLLKRLGIK
jgi:hypothetical protein